MIPREVFAIDPGNEVTSWLCLDAIDKRIVAHAEEPNAEVLARLRKYGAIQPHGAMGFVVEIVEGYGMSVGVETFATCELIGRITEIMFTAGIPLARMSRKTVKLELCSTISAKDKDVRAAAIARWGSEDEAIGKKKTPGPLYGLAGGRWQALGLALAFCDQEGRKK